MLPANQPGANGPDQLTIDAVGGVSPRQTRWPHRTADCTNLGWRVQGNRPSGKHSHAADRVAFHGTFTTQGQEAFRQGMCWPSHFDGVLARIRYANLKTRGDQGVEGSQPHRIDTWRCAATTGSTPSFANRARTRRTRRAAWRARSADSAATTWSRSEGDVAGRHRVLLTAHLQDRRPPQQATQLSSVNGCRPARPIRLGSGPAARCRTSRRSPGRRPCLVGRRRQGRRRRA